MDGLNRQKDTAAARLAALRDEMKAPGVEGFLVPRADEHQGEYVPAQAERLAWLTGFTGSAGLAVVLQETAALFIDGRYTIQASQQVEESLFSFEPLGKRPYGAWIASQLETGTIGVDPWLHTRQQVRALRDKLEAAGLGLAMLERNPLDAAWTDQPAPPKGPTTPHPLDYAGRSSEDKRRDLADALAEKKAAAAVLTLPDSIAWLLNVRGSDVPRVPICLSFAILQADGGVAWFVDPDKVTGETRDALDAGVTIHARDSFAGALANLGGEGVVVDPASAPEWVFLRLEEAGAKIVEGADPCQLPKACKNEVELNGARAAHRRDGVAVSRFLHWIATEAADRSKGNDPVSELEAVEALYGFRQQDALLRDISFDTISGAGPNAALPHYRVSAESNRALKDGEIYLCDSGGQYPDGTTDITRTVILGEPSEEMKDRYTRVLKGHILLATTRFPAGTTGSDLDVLARHALWQAGLDFDHGTGHGVGSYLSVHEGPQRISKVHNKVALKPGMIVSNEPGYYKERHFGIRIENLVAVVESPGGDGEERDMLAFETLTLAPIDTRLIDLDLLSEQELSWLNAYHARVREVVGPQLPDAEEKAWLDEATQPLSR